MDTAKTPRVPSPPPIELFHSQPGRYFALIKQFIDASRRFRGAVLA